MSASDRPPKLSIVSTGRRGSTTEVVQARARSIRASLLPLLNRKTLPGLEFLAQLDGVVVKQEVELLEAFTGFDTNNQYSLSSPEGQRVFFAAENSGCCARFCLRGGRPFEINLLDFAGNSVVSIERPCPCGFLCCCVGLCRNKVYVSHQNGEVLGIVKQICTFCTPSFYVLGPSGNREFFIYGPTGGHWACCRMCCEVTFRICLGDRVTEIGEIRKRWGGVVKEGFSAADTFGVKFPIELDPKLKAVLLGAVFIIDFMYFENAGARG